MIREAADNLETGIYVGGRIINTVHQICRWQVSGG